MISTSTSCSVRSRREGALEELLRRDLRVLQAHPPHKRGLLPDEADAVTQEFVATGEPTNVAAFQAGTLGDWDGHRL